MHPGACTPYARRHTYTTTPAALRPPRPRPPPPVGVPDSPDSASVLGAIRTHPRATRLSAMRGLSAPAAAPPAPASLHSVFQASNIVISLTSRPPCPPPPSVPSSPSRPFSLSAPHPLRRHFVFPRAPRFPCNYPPQSIARRLSPDPRRWRVINFIPDFIGSAALRRPIMFILALLLVRPFTFREHRTRTVIGRRGILPARLMLCKSRT